MKKTLIFYSWQSDLPSKINRGAIRSALLNIAADNSGDKYEITIDEATRDEPGSPHIPTTILKKICAADIFIADISTINKDDQSRKCPNPNVIFELGYAVSVIGWSRIILIANEATTDLKNDIPFDIDRNRISTYTIPFDTKLTNKQIKEAITNVLNGNVMGILNKNPVKNSEQIQKSPVQIKRDRDVKNILWILETLHFPTLQMHWEEGPRYLENRMLYFWEDFDSVFRNKLFQIYDRKIYKLLSELHESFEITVSGNYRPTANIERLVWANYMDMPFEDDEEEKRWKLSQNAHSKLPVIVDKIKAVLEKSYIEISLEDTSRVAWARYVEFKKRMKETYGD